MSALVQEMACRYSVPSYFMNQCRIIIDNNARNKYQIKYLTIFTHMYILKTIELEYQSVFLSIFSQPLSVNICWDSTNISTIPLYTVYTRVK